MPERAMAEIGHTWPHRSRGPDRTDRSTDLKKRTPSRQICVLTEMPHNTRRSLGRRVPEGPFGSAA
jgi:hypothetical protein